MLPTETDFESKFTLESEANPLADEPPFHILVLGDWSGNATKKDLSERRPIEIDRDNFDEVLQKLKVSLALDLNGDGNLLNLEFTELDDFHPDNLFRQVSLFADLRDVRRRLKNADDFNEAARQVRAWFDMSEETQIEEIPPISSDNLLDQILSTPGETSVSKPKKVDNSELGVFLSKIVSPHLIKIDENEQSKLVAAVDEATSELMRTILHHPQFQALESAWRGLYFLVRQTETDTDLKLFIFDVSQVELTGNLSSIKSLADSFLFRWLITETDETLGGEPFALVCGNYSFGVNVDDIAALMRTAKISNAAATPFISHIRPEMFGINSFVDNSDFTGLKFSEESTEGKLWNALRNMPEADSIGFSPMRFLSRLPYGQATDSTETFSFEEFTGNIAHENYLWTNTSFICALLLAQSYRRFGWDEMGENLIRDIENLPLHIYRQNAETITKPCAEIVLTEKISESILQQGLMPLLSYRNTDRVRLARFQSAAFPSKQLNSKWNK